MTASPERYDVYISFNQKDADDVRQIADRLRDEGVAVWFFDWYVGGGDTWTAKMKEALAHSASSAVFFGAAGLGPQQSEEVLVNIREREKESGGSFTVIPVLLPGADPSRLPTFLRERSWVDFRVGIDGERAFALLLADIRKAATAQGKFTGEPGDADERHPAPEELEDALAASSDSPQPENFEAGRERAGDSSGLPEFFTVAHYLEGEGVVKSRFSQDGQQAFLLAGQMALAADRPTDSTLYLASILSTSPPNLRHSGHAFLTALQAQRPSPEQTTAKPDVVELLRLTEYDLVELPSSSSPDAMHAQVSREMEWLLPKAAELAVATNSAEGTVRTRHVIGAMLAPLPLGGRFGALKRLEFLDYDVEKLRDDFLAHVGRYQPGTLDRWKEIFASGAGSEAAPSPGEPQPPIPPQPTDEPPAPDEEVGRESIQQSNISDQPSARDTLGFAPYVKAIATFLNNEKTQPPLTLSVEGEWGSGKSSFMLQLAEALAEELRADPHRRRRAELRRRIPELRRERLLRYTPLQDVAWLRRFRVRRVFEAAPPPKLLTVEFNPWRHDKENALWASFALEFVRKLSQNMSAGERLRAYLKLLARRFKWTGGGLILLRMGFLVLLMGALVWALVQLYRADPALLLGPAASGDKEGAALLGVLKASGFAGYFAAVLFFLSKFREFIGNPFAFDLRRYIESPDYEGNIAFIEQFHEDFNKIVETYAGGNKVYVFIDDLDRADVPKAADLMQAINLMISGGAPQLIFIIGMDREKVAAGLAVKNEKLLPYLAQKAARPAAKADAQPAAGAKAEAQAAASSAQGVTFGLEYGYNFIEKFIQIPFSVPQPAQMGVSTLLDFIAPLVEVAADGGAKAQPPAANTQAAPGGNGAGPPDNAARPPVAEDGRDVGSSKTPGAATSPGAAHDPKTERDAKTEERDAAVILSAAGGTPVSAATQKAPAEKEEEEKEGLMLLEKGDSLTVRNIVLMAAPALDYNPRRIKQFINLFRLKAYIAYETGLFRRPRAGSPYNGLTLEQLGKFVAIGLRWPRLLADLGEDHTLLAELQNLARGFASESTSQAADNWRRRDDLMNLLKFGCVGVQDPFDQGRPIDPSRYSLSYLDVRKLLEVSPRVTRPAPAGPPAGATANVSQATQGAAPPDPTGTATGDVSAEVVGQPEAPPS